MGGCCYFFSFCKCNSQTLPNKGTSLPYRHGHRFPFNSSQCNESRRNHPLLLVRVHSTRLPKQGCPHVCKRRQRRQYYIVGLHRRPHVDEATSAFHRRLSDFLPYATRIKYYGCCNTVCSRTRHTTIRNNAIGLKNYEATRARSFLTLGRAALVS